MPHCYLVAFGLRLGPDGHIDQMAVASIADTGPGLLISVTDAGSLPSALFQIEHALSEDAQLVTDGAYPIRQSLHPEAIRIGCSLSPIFHLYHDIRKETMTQCEDIDEPLKHNDINTDLLQEVESLRERTRTILSGNENAFSHPERIQIGLENAVCVPQMQIDTTTIVRARGLPWQASDLDVARFFAGLNIAPGGVALCLSKEGRRNGEALVRFCDTEQANLALARHRHFLDSRYIEVYRATATDFLQVASGSSSEALQFVSRPAAMIVRMRGLPYDCADEQIREFFATGDEPSTVSGILFVRRVDGRPTGDAFVLFADEADGDKALKKHKRLIGSRYIELFRSTTAEVQQVVRKSTESSSTPLPSQILSQKAPISSTSLPGTSRDCLRLRGLPFEAQVQHVVEFLGESAAHIVFQGVHMVYNSAGQPSGEAFIQMESERAAAMAASLAHNKFMAMGKKQRYIEVFQCCADDMQLMLASPSVSVPFVPSPLVTPSPTLFPMLSLYWPCPPYPPSPPVSPASLFPQPGLLLLRGLAPSTSLADLLAFFHGYSDISAENVAMLGQGLFGAGEALVSFRSALEAERALVERSGHLLAGTPVQLCLVSL